MYLCLTICPVGFLARIAQFNLSHSIDRLSFGTEFPGLVNPLDGHKVELEECEFGVVRY